MSPRNTGRILELVAQATPKRLAATLGDETLSFGEAERRANRTAHALAALGLGRGDRVLFWSAISLRCLDVFYAAQKLGAVFVPLNPAFSADEAAAMFDYVRPAFFIADAAHADTAAELVLRAVSPCVLAITGAAEHAVPGIDLDAASAKAGEARPVVAGLDDEDIHALFLTSGSTGRPKGVMVSHRANWVRTMERSSSPAPAAGGGGEVCMFPLFHFAGWQFITSSWAHGRAVHLAASTDADTLLGMVERWRPSYLYCIPAVWERILACTRSYDTRSLRYTHTGTSRIEPQLIERLRARFPHAGRGIFYGSTEFGGALGLNHDDIERKPYSVGLPQPGAEARIDDGELCLRGPGMASGYFDLPEQTAEVFVDGWYRSGDLAEQDDEGYFTITGRRREIIRTGGETVAPAEVEAVLRSCPGIADAAVIGLPDPQWGELVCAVVVPAPGAAPPSIEALRRQIGNSLAAFKHPRRIVAVSSLPRTAATGQIQRSAIRQQFLAGDVPTTH